MIQANGRPSEKYYGHTLITVLCLAGLYAAAWTNRLAWGWFLGGVGLAFGWITPALLVEGLRLYARAVYSVPPGTVGVSSNAPPSSGGGGGSGGADAADSTEPSSVRTAGAGRSSSGGTKATASGRAPSSRARREVVEVVEVDPVPRLSLPAPGFLGLFELMGGWRGAVGVGVGAVLVVMLLGALAGGCSSGPSLSDVVGISAKVCRARDTVAPMVERSGDGEGVGDGATGRDATAE